jgi:hypothetical protein
MQSALYWGRWFAMNRREFDVESWPEDYMAIEGIGKGNVGRIAERIVANELEYRGFRVSDLNKEGLSANADLLAVRDGRAWQIQVKGASFETAYLNGWWFSYGYCSEDIIKDRSLRMFNRATAFYRAEIVVLVCVKAPMEYHCLVLPVERAEEAAQMNLDYAYRTKKRDGSTKKPNKVWVGLRYVPNTKDAVKKASMEAEREFIEPFIDKWDF